jgi:protocatechuate 3,4-dioxygenase beta subunit
MIRGHREGTAQKGWRPRCMLAASSFMLVLVLAGCGGAEPGSSEAEPSTSPPAKTTAQAAAPSGSEGGARSADEPASCEPTQPDALGPFYEPNAPVRTSVGSGYVLSGAVLAADGCEPVREARIELWLANPRGEYDDAHRATVFAGERGGYRFESNVPVSYSSRPPHIHLRVTAPGYRELVTQHYPDAGQTEADFDLVLEPL